MAQKLMTLDEAVAEYLKETLTHTGGNQKDAAEIAGISPRMISHRIRLLGLRDFARGLRDAKPTGLSKEPLIQKQVENRPVEHDHDEHPVGHA